MTVATAGILSIIIFVAAYALGYARSIWLHLIVNARFIGVSVAG